MSFELGNVKKLNIHFQEKFELNDIDVIVKEVLENEDYQVTYANRFEDTAVITVKEISQEQITKIEEKLKEKYSSFSESENITQLIEVPSAKAIDLVIEYIKPLIITTVAVIILLAILFRKQGILKCFVLPLAFILGINAFYISVIAILRIPVSEYLVAVGMFVYCLSLIGTTLYMKSKANAEN